MPRSILFQSDFTGGELSPRLYGRVDFDRFMASLKTATNVIIQPQGPIIRRNGTKYISEVKTSSKTVRLVEFQFSADDAFILEFGDSYIRFYTSQAQVQSGGGAYEISSPWDEGEVLELQYTQLADVVYITHPDHSTRTLTRTSTTNWDLKTILFNPPPVRELGDTPTTTCTPAATTGTSVNFTVGTSYWLAGDVGRQIINNADGETGRAVITSITSGTVAVAEIIEAFTDTNAIASGDWQVALSPIGELNITGNGKLGEQITIQAETTDSSAAQNTWHSTAGESIVGKYIRLQNGLVKVTQRTNADTVVGTVVSALDSTSATTIWTVEEEIWGSANGFPRSVGQYQQRLVLGGTSAFPQSLWASRTGNFDIFAGGAQDDSSLDLTLSSQAVNRIEWISGGQQLLVGTSGDEFSIRSAPGSGTTISPSSVQAEARTNYSSKYPQQIVRVGGNTIFTQSAGKKLRSYFYDFNVDNYKGVDLTFWAEHLTDAGIKEIAFAKNPDNLLYVVLDDGDMLCGVYLPELENPVLGWTRITTDGSFENVQTITNGGVDEVWVVVKRTINGTTKRYIELFDNSDGSSNTDGFSDSYLTLSGPKTITNITKANPAVVTSASHNLSNGGIIRITDVTGMTEVNGLTFKIGNVATNTFELENKTPVDIISDSYQWTASGSGTDEYYLEASGGGDPSISAVTNVYESGSVMTGGTAGSLSTGEWDYGDNDSLGYSTIYVRLSDGADPDTKGRGVVQYGQGIDSSAYTAYVSGGKAYEQVSTITGLSHLEGAEVQVKVDGAAHPNKTVSSGSISLDFSGGEVVVGLPYTALIETLTPSIESSIGQMSGQRIRDVRTKLRLYKSAKPNVTNNFDPARVTSDPMDAHVPLFTGEADYGAIGWTDTGILSISMTLPFPLQLQAIIRTIETEAA